MFNDPQEISADIIPTPCNVSGSGHPNAVGGAVSQLHPFCRFWAVATAQFKATQKRIKHTSHCADHPRPFQKLQKKYGKGDPSVGSAGPWILAMWAPGCCFCHVGSWGIPGRWDWAITTPLIQKKKKNEKLYQHDTIQGFYKFLTSRSI